MKKATNNRLSGNTLDLNLDLDLDRSAAYQALVSGLFVRAGVVALTAVCFVFSTVTLSASAQRTAPETVHATGHEILLGSNESDVHHIVTTTHYADGYSEVRHGTGFVVGRRFITVYHNVDVLRDHGIWERRIELGGVEVEPAIVDGPNDIAIFNVPESLCATWCNDRDPATVGADLEKSQPIGWYEFVSPIESRQWRQARVIEVMFKNYRGPAVDTVCDSDVVITVDKPFYPGSSGGPVWDLASNRLLGMVQGSFVRESGEQVGYYKPFSCVQPLLTGRIGPESFRLLTSSR